MLEFVLKADGTCDPATTSAGHHQIRERDFESTQLNVEQSCKQSGLTKSCIAMQSTILPIYFSQKCRESPQHARLVPQLYQNFIKSFHNNMYFMESLKMMPQMQKDDDQSEARSRDLLGVRRLAINSDVNEM